MKSLLLPIVSLGVSLVFQTATGDSAQTSVSLKGYLGERLDAMIRRSVEQTDLAYVCEPFQFRTERQNGWQTEFWGKYMHSAVPYSRYQESSSLWNALEDSVSRVVATQEEDGYIGNYPQELRCGDGWDVWGMKYTMLGLLHYYDGTRSGDKETVSRGDKALIACRKLCDYLIRELGPDGRRKRQLWESGNWSGMASSSVLEPVVWLYKRTSDARYLEFARYIVDGMSTPASGPRLIDLALKGVSVADRNGFGNTPERHGGYVMKSNRWKAYEMMSCYQGLLEYYEVTGQKQVLDAVLASARDIVREEVNLAGGCSCSEAWFHGAHKQTRPYRRLQETCVTVTWMRLCEKLLDLTKDAQWADQIERTFYNAYLAALKSDGAGFAGYTPLSGYRYHGQHHCHLHMDCCTANGPRGFLPIIERMFSSDDSGYTVNFYSSALLRLSFNGKEPPQTAFEMYSLYPRDEEVRLVCHVSSHGTKSLRLRMPKWCSRFDLKVNGAAVGVNRNGGYAVVRREWAAGDVIDLKIGMPVVAHVQDHHVAFTRGPILLARDSRLEDVLLSEPIRRGSFQDGDVIQEFVPIRTSSEAFWMQFYGTLPMASHDENPEGRKPRSIRFCDYASAGNLWSETNGYQTWFPFELAAHE